MLELNIHRFIKPLKKKWRSLEQNEDASPYQSFFIQQIVSKRHIINMISKHYIPAYCEIKEDGCIVLIAPLLQKIDNKKRIFTSFMGFTGFNIYDFVYKANLPEKDLKRYIEFMLKALKADQLVLDDIPENSKLFKALDLMRDDGYYISFEKRENVNINIGKDYEKYYSGLSKHARQNIRTAYNRLTADGKSVNLEYVRGEKLDRKKLNALLQIYLNRRANKYAIRKSPFYALYIKYFDFSTAYQQKYSDNIYIYID